MFLKYRTAISDSLNDYFFVISDDFLKFIFSIIRYCLYAGSNPLDQNPLLLALVFDLYSAPTENPPALRYVSPQGQARCYFEVSFKLSACIENLLLKCYNNNCYVIYITFLWELPKRASAHFSCSF